MKYIKLTKGKRAIVDDEDYEYLNQWRWHLSTSGYATRHQHIRTDCGKKFSKIVRMHRLINNTPDHLITDHINRNKLDNRKSNLRNSNKSLNNFNRGASSANKSGHVGVHFETWSNKWRAEMKVRGKKLSLGRFEDMKDAIAARKKAESSIDFYAV